MREIKFRAFFKGEMFPLDQITFTDKEWSCKNGRGISLYAQPHINVMQFTGMKDKNGKEMWEGDIVEAIFNAKGKETDIKFNAIIIYNSHIGAFQISYKNIDNQFVNDTIWLRYFLKVIGNIYETPELLKQ